MGYRFGFSEFTTKPWSFETDVERYAAHGVDAIEVCEFKLERGRYEESFAAIDAAGLSVSSVQTTVHALFPDSLAPKPANCVERLGIILESIGRIAPHLPAGTPFNIITGAAPGGNCDEVYRWALSALSTLADRAATFDTTVAFEPLNPVLYNSDTALWGFDRALDLIDRIDHPALGVTCDFWNVFETPHLAMLIEEARERILLVQISDWRMPRSNADRLCVGDGSLPLESYVAALRAIDYARPYVVEIFSSEDLADSLWRSDLDVVIERNIAGFERVWQQSAVHA